MGFDFELCIASGHPNGRANPPIWALVPGLVAERQLRSKPLLLLEDLAAVSKSASRAATSSRS
jgi:hypothetical protein